MDCNRFSSECLVCVGGMNGSERLLIGLDQVGAARFRFGLLNVVNGCEHLVTEFEKLARNLSRVICYCTAVRC